MGMLASLTCKENNKENWLQTNQIINASYECLCELIVIRQDPLSTGLFNIITLGLNIFRKNKKVSLLCNSVLKRHFFSNHFFLPSILLKKLTEIFAYFCPCSKTSQICNMKITKQYSDQLEKKCIQIFDNYSVFFVHFLKN